VCPITLMGLQACYNSSNMRLMASRTLTLCREEEDSGLSTDGEALAVFGSRLRIRTSFNPGAGLDPSRILATSATLAPT